MMKQNLFFFYKGSHGELHAGLPFIINIIEDKRTLKPYFLYKRKQFELLPCYYKDIIKDNFSLVSINFFSILLLFFTKFFQRNFIFTCDNGHTRKSASLTCYWPFSRVIFFHHAYAFLGGGDLQKTDGFYLERYNGFHHDPLVIAHNEYEVEHRINSGFKRENVIISGNLGYKEKWKELIGHSSNGNCNGLGKTNFGKRIFIPVRDVHQQYLTKENYDYLFESLLLIIKRYPNYHFLIKLHPRQKNVEDFFNLELRFENVSIVELNTITVARASDLVISYWSSAIIDSLSVNTPVVEFHRHDVFHEQLVKTNDKLVSLYHSYDLCPFYSDVESIINLLSDLNSWSVIRDNQQDKYKSIFLESYPEFVDNLFFRLDRVNFNSRFFVSLLTLPVNGLKRRFTKIKNKVKNKIKMT